MSACRIARQIFICIGQPGRHYFSKPNVLQDPWGLDCLRKQQSSLHNLAKYITYSYNLLALLQSLALVEVQVRLRSAGDAGSGHSDWSEPQMIMVPDSKDGQSLRNVSSSKPSASLPGDNEVRPSDSTSQSSATEALKRRHLKQVGEYWHLSSWVTSLLMHCLTLIPDEVHYNPRDALVSSHNLQWDQSSSFLPYRTVLPQNWQNLPCCHCCVSDAEPRQGPKARARPPKQSALAPLIRMKRKYGNWLFGVLLSVFLIVITYQIIKLS